MDTSKIERDLQNVADQYKDKIVSTGAVHPGNMATDCLRVIKGLQAENARLTKEMDLAKQKVADLFEKSDELVEEQSAFIDELQAQLRTAEKVCYAAHMYVKNSNSPLCVGWDMLLDALQKWVDGKRGPQGGEGGVHSAEASP